MIRHGNYPHTPEECGDHDLDIDTECNGCGKDAVEIIEEERKEAVAKAVKEDRAALCQWLFDNMELWQQGSTDELCWAIEAGKHVPPKKA